MKAFIEIKVPEYSRALPTCKPARADQFCQSAHVSIPGDSFPLVPRYPAILAKLGSNSISPFGQPRVCLSGTYAVLPPGADAVAEAKPGAGSLRKLEEGELVAAVATKDGWAEVSQDGKTIGYVPQERLLKLKR